MDDVYLDEAPVALNKKGLPIKSGHKDACKRDIRPGDLFVLVRQGVKQSERLIVKDEELARRVYVTGGRGYTWAARRTVEQDGLTKVRIWKDVIGTDYKRVIKNGAATYEPRPNYNRVVGHNVYLRPGTFGVLMKRHEARPSQWHALIGNRHYSVSNQTVQVIRDADEFEAIQRMIEEQNSRIPKDEWKRVIEAAFE